MNNQKMATFERDFRIAALTTDDVQSVYSGKLGCACGCRGKYRYNSKHLATASADRGYEVMPDEVNDRQIKAILSTVQAATVAGKADDVDMDTTFYAVRLVTDAGTERDYVVYPTAAALAKKLTLV